MRIRPLPLLSVAAITIVATTISAQEQSESPDVLRVETRLVQVDVVVRNDDGPVTDLAADDFRLFADGGPAGPSPCSKSFLQKTPAPGTELNFPRSPKAPSRTARALAGASCPPVLPSC